MNTMKKIKHIAIVVKDMEKTIETYRDMFGFEVTGTLDIPSGEVRIVMISCGDITLELFQPLRETGQYADFLKKTGGGLHHIAFETDNVDEDFNKLKAQGRKLQSEAPITIPIGKICFVAAGDEDVLVELMQSN
jgi:methylmalonyl-CoA/ethylmalonyl-CoA epimerase